MNPAIILHQDSIADEDRDILLVRITAMKDLPTLPQYIAKITHLLRNENVNVNALVKAMEQDPALIIQIMRMINSGYYGLRTKITQVERAVALLGIIGIKQLVYSVAIMDIFGSDEATVWAHSYSSSMLMAKIIRELNLPVAENLVLTMLMHDIGKVVFRRLSPRLWAQTNQYAREKGITVAEAETHIFHLDHAEAGQLVMQNWQMTDDLIIPIAFHHIEDRLPDQWMTETAVVKMVNYIDCEARGIICHAPKPGLLKKAGLLGFDFDYWIGYQQNAIRQLDEIAAAG